MCGRYNIRYISTLVYFSRLKKRPQIDHFVEINTGKHRNYLKNQKSGKMKK